MYTRVLRYSPGARMLESKSSGRSVDGLGLLDEVSCDEIMGSRYGASGM